MQGVFSVRSLFLLVSGCAVIAALIAILQPPDYHRMACRRGKQSPPVHTVDLEGSYCCGIRGYVHELELDQNGSYELTESGCFGVNGRITGRWQVIDNVVRFDPLTEWGDIGGFAWAYVGQSDGLCYLVYDKAYESFIARGYSPMRCLTKEEIAALRAAATVVRQSDE